MKKTILALLFLIMSFPLFGETYYQNNNKYAVADTFQVCGKDAGDSYAWRVIY